MSLLVFGINHKSADLALRERVVFAPEHMEDALANAMGCAALAEVVALSTCNRTELYAVVDDCEQAPQMLLDWLAGYHRVASDELERHSYQLRDDEAVRHMMQVASGLDSMVLGEPQILGQMKSALVVAEQAGVVGPELSRVFQQVFSVAKRVRTDTAIGQNPVSVAYAAVSLTQHIFSDLGELRALLIGAGETIELVARHLRDRGIGGLTVANRTLSRARELAEHFDAEAVLLAEVPEQLVSADIVITSTASQLPILGKGAVESALKRRRHRPVLMVDIAVPRDIEPEVGELDDVYLYTIDDLTEIVDENRRAREHEARKADIIIDEGVRQFHQQLRALDAVSTVRAYRRKAEQLRDAELQRALKRLARGDNPEAVLQQFARGLTNKLLHSPSAQLRKASAEGRQDVIQWTRELFELSHRDDIGTDDKEPPAT